MHFKNLRYSVFFLHLQSLEFTNVNVTPKMMQSIASLGIKLKKFGLFLANSTGYNHKPETIIKV